MSDDSKAGSSAYRHSQKSVQRPDVGVEAQFPNKKKPKTHRYDSSLAPELCWDESAERAFAEWLLHLVTEAAEKGEHVVFAQPQVWEGAQESFSSLSQCAARLKSLTKPFLNWAGKAERQQISVPTLPLFVHERHSTQAILEALKSHKASGTTLDLFGDAGLDIADKLDAYHHKGPWTNRLVLGDSLHVMNSLLEYEGLGGQVQMIYFDPPYGVKFGSNFQPFVRKRDVTHGKDDEMIREPEMVKAYRDTWELGLHSYLAYLRDRLLLARELLHESGSIFVQISDENLHHVREVMDEVFGADNFIAVISFTKTSSASGELLSSVCDFIVWYAKDERRVKYHQLYQTKEIGSAGATQYTWAEHPDGVRKNYGSAERLQDAPDGVRVFVHDNLTSQRPAQGNDVRCFEHEGRTFRLSKGTFKTDLIGLTRLADARRMIWIGNTLRYVRFLQDFPAFPISNSWSDTSISGFAAEKLYVVQTMPIRFVNNFVGQFFAP